VAPATGVQVNTGDEVAILEPGAETEPGVRVVGGCNALAVFADPITALASKEKRTL